MLDPEAVLLVGRQRPVENLRSGEPPADNGRVRALGVSIAGGKIFVCAADPGKDGLLAVAVPAANRRFEANAGLDEVARLADLTERLRGYLEPLQLDRVVLTEVRKYSQWKYRDAQTHVLGIAALLGACHQLGLAFETVTTEKIAKAVKVPADKLGIVGHAEFSYEDRPTYWTAGLGAAHAAAAYAVLGAKT